MPPKYPTVAQTTRLRQRPHRTRTWLSVYQPQTVFAAQINQPGIAKGTRQITIASISGQASGVLRGMTCYIGTTPGGRDLGRLRAISATATEMTLAENALNWVNGWYLTVCAYYEPWAVFSRIVLQSNIPIFYKDYDVLYTSQNENMRPVVVMGPNHAGFMATGALGVYYSSSGTYTPSDLSMPTGYAWVFEGGTPTGSQVKDPGLIQYTGAGHFLTTLTVTSNDGVQSVGHRHVSVYTRPDEGPNPPILRWSLKSLEGARDNGGWSASIAIHQSVNISQVVDGALVVLFTDDWEGGVAGKVAAGSENRSSILFVGYIEDDSIRVLPDRSTVDFRVAGLCEYSKRLSTYSATLESVADAASWNEMNDMTVDMGVVGYLQWQSTLLEIADFHRTGDAQPVNYLDFGRGDLYEAYNGLYNSALLASVVSDRQGAMWAEKEASILPTGTARNTALGTGFSMSRQDWRSELAITRRPRTDLAYLELGGIAFAGPGVTTGVNVPYLAGAPGEVSDYFGTVERTTGLVLTDQTDLNSLVGLAWARANALFPEVTIRIAADYRFIDIAPQMRLLLNMTAEDNYRGSVWTNKPFVPYAMTYESKPEEQTILPEVRVREETAGGPGTTITIPVEPPYTDNDLPDWQITFPPIMPFPGIFPPILPEPPDTEAVFAFQYYSGAIRMFRCDDITAASPIWVSIAIPGGSYVGTDLTHVWLNIYNPLDQAFIWTQLGGLDPATQGPYGYLVSGLSGPTSAWANIWNATQNQILEPGGVKRNMAFIGQPPSLGYFIGAARESDLGGHRPVYGGPGSWSILTSVYCPGGGWSTGIGGNIGHIGGTTLLGAGGGLIGRSDNLHNTWALEGDGAGSYQFYSMVSDGVNVIWGFQNLSTSVESVLHHPAGLLPIATAFDSAVDIKPYIGGTAYMAHRVDIGSWHTFKSIINAYPYIYMLGGNVNGLGLDFRWFVKSSFLPTAADWQAVYSLSDWRLYGVDVSLLDPLRVIANHYKAVTPGHIWYSEDGGAHWTDKTGNLGAVGWFNQGITTLKFAIGSAAIV
jgi:hypothetical protein